jgi:hypothetical protein
VGFGGQKFCQGCAHASAAHNQVFHMSNFTFLMCRAAALGGAPH